MFKLFLVVTFLYIFGIGVSTAKAKGTIIPLYSYPKTDSGRNTWKPLLDAYKKHPIEVWAIINVENGPGKTKDTDYDAAVSNLKSVGINTLGYVSTNYAKRSKALILKDVDLWKTLYKPTGIFFDEMTSDDNTGHIDFYKNLTKYSKDQGYTFTVGNPGTDVPLGYFAAVDTVMIYESPRFPTIKTVCNKKYKQLSNSSSLGIFPYDVKKLNESLILKAKNCVGYIYATNDKGANPWDTLPSYLPKLFEILSR